MLKQAPTRPKAVLALALPLLLLWPALAAAVPISSCGSACTTNCELVNDIVCTAGQDGVTLTNGADLDMGGYDIECIDEGTVCNTAIKMLAANSTVSNSGGGDGSDPTARIVGSWFAGIDCGAKPGSEVTGISLRGWWSDVRAAIRGCQTVVDNVIAGFSLPGSGAPGSQQAPDFPLVCILHIPIDNSDLVAGNYVDGCESGIASVTGATLITIDNNTVNYRKLQPLGVYPYNAGINLINFNANHNKPAIITNNIVTGDGDGGPISVHQENQQAVFSNNVCRAGLKGCPSCVAQGRCEEEATCTSP